MAGENRRRSRFDERDPDVPRKSRFDRSRSPSGQNPNSSRRSRSPIHDSGKATANADDKPNDKPDGDAANGHTEENAAGKSKADIAAAAAATAARINAAMKNRSDGGGVTRPTVKRPASAASGEANGDAYERDGDFIKDIEVNDLRNRYTLTKGPTQKMIKDETGADITTRGEYYPDKSMATPAKPPLYLHITSTSKTGLDLAVAKIEELMAQDLPNLIDERRFRKREVREEVERDELGRRKWPEDRVPIDLEPVAGFNLRANVVGTGGQNVKHIQAETRCRVQIKGRGSGFAERDTGLEGEEPMYLHITGPQQEFVDHAKSLCEQLMASVRGNYENFKTYGRERGGPRGGGRDRDREHDGRPRSGDHRGHRGGADSHAGYYQQYGQGQPQAGQDGDPYAPWGGYEAYCQYYYFYSQQQQQQQPGHEQAPGHPGGNDQYAGYYGYGSNGQTAPGLAPGQAPGTAPGQAPGTAPGFEQPPGYGTAPSVGPPGSESYQPPPPPPSEPAQSLLSPPGAPGTQNSPAPGASTPNGYQHPPPPPAYSGLSDFVGFNNVPPPPGL